VSVPASELPPAPGTVLSTAPAAPPAEPPPKAGAEDDVHLSLMDHLVDLRKRLTYAAIAVFVCIIISYNFADATLWWLMDPVLDALRKIPAEAGALPQEPWLTVHDSLEYFFVLLRVSLYGGVFLAAPAILYQVWAFVSPGLYRKERELAAPFVILGTVFFVGGGLFARLFVLPFAMEVLVTQYAHPHVRQMFSISAELDFVLASVLAFGIIFELPLILTLLAQIGIVSSAFLSKWRRHAMIGNVILAAIITPTGDPFNLALMAVPLIVCYELGILGARLVERRKRANEALPAA
jgi:sec-independent protein translocase protein TatC